MSVPVDPKGCANTAKSLTRLRLTFDRVEGWLESNRTDLVNRELGEFVGEFMDATDYWVEEVGVVLALGYLVSTASSARRLENRALLLAAVRLRLTEIRSAEEAERLLRGIA